MMANPFFDWLMPLFDKPKDWIIFVVVFWLYAAYRDPKYRKMLLILVPLTILFCDQLGGFIKDFEFKNRPWFEFFLMNFIMFIFTHVVRSCANIIGLLFVCLFFQTKSIIAYQN